MDFIEKILFDIFVQYVRKSELFEVRKKVFHDYKWEEVCAWLKRERHLCIGVGVEKEVHANNIEFYCTKLWMRKKFMNDF